MKLYDIYSVISNKTVRPNEKRYRKYRSHPDVPGTLVRTNRGFFIDKKNVDLKSAQLYRDLVKAAYEAK